MQLWSWYWISDTSRIKEQKALVIYAINFTSQIDY